VGIRAFVDALKTSARAWPFTVGWIDCLSRGRAMGRGLLIRGRWAQPHEAPPRPPAWRKTLAVPCVLPQWVLNPLAVRAFNALYYRSHWPFMKRGIAHPEKFFYPLDALRDWNRLYGPRGFTQHQCVLPEKNVGELTHEFMDILTREGGAGFLCVIKDCGPQGRGMLSFPMKGISIALDIPVRLDTQHLVDTLNDFVAAHGGRVYLAKDAFTRPEHFHQMEPRLAAWQAVRRQWDPEQRIRSAQSVRLLGDPP
jgi:FAD/FMN-containing dehydrogenase